MNAIESIYSLMVHPQNVQLYNGQLQNVQLPDIQLQNVQFVNLKTCFKNQRPKARHIWCGPCDEMRGPSIYWCGDTLNVNRKTHQNSCVWLGDTDRHSVCLPYLLKNRLVFSPSIPEKEIFFFKRKLQISNKPRSSQSKIYLENLPPSWPPSVLIVFYF
jgi:hypothetical protein